MTEQPVARDPNTPADPNSPEVSPPPQDPNETHDARFASVQEPNAAPYTLALAVAPEPESHAAEGETVTELVGFVVRGRWLIERLQIDDLDSLVMPNGDRLLPLLRILRAFKLTIEEQGGILRFAPEGVGSIELDVPRGQIQIKGQTRPIKILQAVSEITLKPDLYVSPEDLAEILDMELVWNNELYEYRIQLDRKLSIWKFGSGRSALSIQAQYVETDLPQALPPADRSRDPLQLIQFDWHPSYSWRQSASNVSEGSHTVEIGAPRETLWGNGYNGQYKVQISHPSRTWSNTQGWRWPNDDPYIAQVDWFEWVHRLSSAEITVGDSAFGLSDLVYPVFDATGVRINGLIGWNSEELKTDRSNRGLRQYFGQTHVFEGPAPIDAEVELVLNGRTIEIQTVRPEAEAPPGMGLYRFEDIELPSGILNEVTILIREVSGNEIRVEKSVVGAPQLLPQGRTAYLGVLGTKRERDTFGEKDDFYAGDFFGYITGGRMLYGLTDRVTVGVTGASEEDHNHRFLEMGRFLGRRAYPESSRQAGATVSYMPKDNLILSGDVAASQGEGRDDYDDIAARSRVEYLPARNLTLDLDWLNLGANYYDGTQPDVSDRRGGETGFSWQLHKKWALEGGLGQIRDNLDGQLDETTEVDYLNLGLLTTILPRTTLTAKLHHLDVSTEEEPRLLTELGLRLMPARNLSLYGRVFLGDELTIERDDRFLTLLRLRHAPRHLRPSQYWSLRRSLNPSNAVSLLYTDAEIEETLSLVHDLKLDMKDHPLRLRTELIRELTDEPDGHEYGFRARGEYLLDHTGYNYLGVAGEYRHGDYSLLLYLNIRQLLSRHNKRLINISDTRIRTAYGAVHGRVFIDYNANHIPDANEPGVPGVKVHLGASLGAVTDRKGYYILSVPPNASEVRVYLDPGTVPATYSVTHGTQLARIYRDSLTEVNLSVAPLISVVGHVVATDPNASEPNAVDPNAPEARAMILDVTDPNEATVEMNPLSGVRVYLSDAQSDLLVADSFTAADGSYYLGDVKPGRYKLRVDPKTLPAAYELAERERIIEVKPTSEEFLEIEQPDLVATVQGKTALPKDSPPTNNGRE